MFNVTYEAIAIDTPKKNKKPTYLITDKLAFFSSKSIIITFYE